jgi:hypothetical protein
MFNVKEFELTNNGKRNVFNCNAIRNQMYNKIMEVVSNAGFEVKKAANGDIAIPTAIDAATGEVYYTRLAVSFSSKDLESKTERKPKEKETVNTAPVLFDDKE